MPTVRFPVSNIESYMPSIDARNAQTAYALDGRNFMFGPLGPGSLFGSRRLGALPLYAPHNVQGIRVQDRSFVFTEDAILTWRTNVPFMWELLYQFAGSIPNNLWLPWSALFYTNKFIFIHAFRGVYTADLISDSDHLWLERQTENTIPGLLTGIRGATVARNRAILVSKDTIQWSNTDDFSDFTPALGGAGFQFITSFVRGTFLSVTGFGDGFIVWTTGGAVMAEFIGGDEVWRWTAYDTKEKPIGPWTTVELSNGITAFLSRHGLVINPNDAMPEGWTKDFNEYFLDYMKDPMHQRSHWRVDYDSNKQNLFISESADRQTYFRTLVLSPTRNKWGIFSERHYGLLSLTPDLFGFVDDNGYANYLEPSLYSRESIPDPSELRNVYYPLQEKQHRIPSSTAVSNSYDPDETVPMPVFDPVQIAWYPPGIDFPVAPSLIGMDSWIEIGYLRPEQLQGSADGLVEIQETLLGSVPSVAPTDQPFATAWKTESFFAETEDWDSDAEVSEADIFENWNTMPDEIENWGSMPDSTPVENWTLMVEYTYDFDDVEIDDWNEGEGDEDWNGLGINFPSLSYDLSLKSSLDGITFAEFVPTMARFNHGATLFTGLTTGNLHRLRLEANDLGQFYQIRSLDLTEQYAGEVA